MLLIIFSVLIIIVLMLLIRKISVEGLGFTVLWTSRASLDALRRTSGLRSLPGDPKQEARPTCMSLAKSHSHLAAGDCCQPQGNASNKFAELLQQESVTFGQRLELFCVHQNASLQSRELASAISTCVGCPARRSASSSWSRLERLVHKADSIHGTRLASQLPRNLLCRPYRPKGQLFFFQVGWVPATNRWQLEICSSRTCFTTVPINYNLPIIATEMNPPCLQ